MKLKTLFTLLLFILLFNIPAFAASISNDSKITPITGIILLCSGSGDECDDQFLQRFIISTPIKFLNRKNLRGILDEQTLQSSGLSVDNTRRIGKLVGASHILLYKKTADFLHIVSKIPDILYIYELKLINVETSEEEYWDNPVELSDIGKRKAPAELVDQNLTSFFEIICRHSAKK